MCAPIIFNEDGRELQVNFVVISIKSLYLGCGRVLILYTCLLEIFTQVPLVNSGPLNYVCHRGTFLLTPRLGPDFCLPCKDGVGFMPESLHRHRLCYNCTQIQDDTVEILISPCNRTQDTEILCKEGFYRRKSRNVREIDTCVKCSDCENVARPCQGYYDTVCCLPSYEAVLSKHGFFECKERPIVCGAGEFLSLKTEQCSPCSPGTFMTSDKHNNTNCLVCQTLDDVGPHQEIVQPCNRTQPTIFSCQAGFYKDENKEQTHKENSCWPCGRCERTIRECSPTQDSACCDEPDKIVVETVNGSTCTTLGAAPPPDIRPLKDPVNNSLLELQKVFCRSNESMILSFNGTNVTCLPCPEGSYPETGNHTHTFCKNVSDVKDDLLSTNSHPNESDEYTILECLISAILFIMIVQTNIALYTNSNTKIMMFFSYL